uniref:Speckle-type POZ protein (inferred by orthology to a human protein) n=1 Tax=Strongyloides papillosus TaxID=174720 RepID=A0A0N5BEN4_STREA
MKKIEKDSFIWKIESFSLSQLIEDKGRISSFFTSKRNNTIKWSLTMYSKDLYGDNKDYISLWLKLEDSSCFELAVLCGFYVLSVDGEKKHKEVTSIRKLNGIFTVCPCHQFLKHDLLLSNDNNELLSNGNLIVGCEIFYYFCGISTANLSKNNNTEDTLDVLLDDIADLVKSSMFSDCDIKIEDSKINACKCILAGRSELFYSILAEQQYKTIPNTIKINDFCLDIVEKMINYLDTGKSPNMSEMALEMLKIAEKYNLKKLKLIAEESLIYNLSIENACEYLVCSELYSGEILKEWSLRFIYLNGENFFNSEKWKDVVSDHPLFVGKLFSVTFNID